MRVRLFASAVLLLFSVGVYAGGCNGLLNCNDVDINKTTAYGGQGGDGGNSYAKGGDDEMGFETGYGVIAERLVLNIICLTDRGDWTAALQSGGGRSPQ